jgi:hypothetical protein
MVESKSDDRMFRVKERLVLSSLLAVVAKGRRVHVVRTPGVAHACPCA